MVGGGAGKSPTLVSFAWKEVTPIYAPITILVHFSLVSSVLHTSQFLAINNDSHMQKPKHAPCAFYVFLAQHIADRQQC